MAVLEFEFKGIDQNFRSSASNVLNDIDKIKKAFGSIGLGIGVDLKTALDGQKVALNDTKIQTQELVKAGKELDNQNKQTRNSIAELTLEQKKLTAEQRASRANLQDSPYSRLSRELNEMRNEAKNLGAQMILLDSAGMKTSSTYNTLENRFKQVQKETLSLDNSIKKLDSDLGQNNRRVGAYGNALGGLQQKQSDANGVAMEFNRIIQDAPFGMMGIGNNIQQLAANWQTYTSQAKAAAASNGTTVTSMSLVRGAISSILSPANLLTLGIAAVTSAWTFYSMNVKTAKEETKDMNNQFTNQIGQLNNVIALSKKQSLTERDKATAIGLYNKELGDTLGKVKTYSELEKALIRNGSNYINYLSLKAQAEATYQLSLQQTAQMMTNIMSLESKGRSTGFLGWVSKASDTIDELVYGAGTQGKTKISSAEAMKIAQLPTDKEFYIAIRGMGDALKRGLKDVRADWKKSIKSADLGADLTQSFNKLGDQLKVPMPSLNLDKTNNSLNKTTDKLKEAIDYLKELQSLSGVSEKDISLVGKVGLDFDVASIKFDYEERIKQIQTLQEQILADTTLTEAKRQELIEETNTYIAYLTGNVLANIKDLSNKATEYLDRMTVKAVKTYKDVEIAESPKQKQGRNREDDKDWKDYANILNQSVNSIFTNLKSNIDEFGLKARSVFYTLGETLGDLIKQLANKNTAKFMEQLTKDAKSFSDLKDNWKNMSSQDKWSAGLGFAGSAVSSLTPQTSSGGQAVGGALSGAAAGMAFGPWGAAIGAVVGGISGIFRAKKARKQERLQQQQLEEQKKANALLERMNALTYASQIIGQKTEYGIVSGVRRNEFGQIVSVVQGQDIIMVADRTNKQKGR